MFLSFSLVPIVAFAVYVTAAICRRQPVPAPAGVQRPLQPPTHPW